MDKKIHYPTQEQIFIDRFFVPKNAKPEFSERMKFNRNIIRQQPGFVSDSVYERTDEKGDFYYVTIAVWENEESIQNAKKTVQAEYEREGFDMPGMLKRLHISIERGTYKNIIE